MSHSIALMLVTDGRQRFCEQTIESLQTLIGLTAFEYTVVVDDGCDPSYSAWLDTMVPWTIHLEPERVKRGFGGAINAGWAALRELEPTHVFHLEDDFVFSRYFRLDQLVRLLDENPKLAQIALKRQPWNPEEMEAGDLINVHWEDYTQHRNDFGIEWYDHRLYFTSNPSLYRYELTLGGWPAGEFSEGRFTHRLLQDPEVTFGYLGRKEDPPWVIHIGGVDGVSERTGVGY